MLVFLARRLAQSLLTLWIVSMLVFTIMFIVSDPIVMLLPQNATQAQREDLRRELGLDRPLPVQYGQYMGRLLRGDLGMSHYTGRPVAELLAERLPATLELATTAVLLATLLGVPLGMLAGARPRHPLSRLAMGGSMIGISIPSFWLGLILMMLFAVGLGWLPTGGRGPTVSVVGAEWSILTATGWRHLILPAATLAAYHSAMILRLTRSQMADTLRQPFIRVCRARGLAERTVVGRHALRHALIPVITVIGLQFGGLLAFSVVTEKIFQWPGLGKLLIDSVAVDRPVVMALLLMVGVAFLLINLLVDLTYALIDPRIRWSAPRGGAS